MRISDWSSDVCSSDLHAPGNIAAQSVRPVGRGAIPQRILYDQQVGDEQQASTRRPYRQIAISLAGQFRFQQELGQIGFGGREATLAGLHERADDRTSRSEESRVGKGGVR